ncbi:hypothetical protein BC941DRAFT_419139 [Chlamydoabsidia padenii]|nr:hypothetical protein BC941DRAFT_419139 [Chlamydoabsidia padenii]
MMHKSVPGRVTLRQDATGVEQDIIVIYTSSQSAQLTTHTTGHDFYLRAHAAFDDDDDYSIDILLPSTMTTMKELVVEINNGTIVANEALHLSFESVTMATTFGTISIENLLSDRIMLATYSGVISGTFRPTERFSVGAYYGHSNIRLLQATSQQENLNIASSSPHGVSSLSLVNNTCLFTT